MSVRRKRIEALRAENPTWSEEQLRKEERKMFHSRSSKKASRGPRGQKKRRQMVTVGG
jgi:hypothetical protein